MSGHIPRRLMGQSAKRRQQDRQRTIHIHGAGTVAVGDASSVTTNTTHVVNPAGERPTFADDLMPATLTTLPILFLILLLALTDQTILLRSIVQEGNALGLMAQLVPLFSPTIVASLVYFAKARGWVHLDARWTNALALAPAVGIGLLVPLSYLALQVGVFAISLIWLRVGHHRKRRRVLVTLLVAVSVLALTASVRWNSHGVDRIPRMAVGRLVDGLTRMNVDDRPGGRSVLVISVNDAYAIVASRGYPPEVQTMPLETLQKGRLCQLQPKPTLVGVVREWTGHVADLPNATEKCLESKP